MTARIRLFTTIITAISFFVLLSSFSSAAEFSFVSPDSVNLNESFSVTINTQLTELQDVKIYVQDANSNILSQTYSDSGWRSSYYFVNASLPQTTSYSVKVIKTAPSYTICVRLRLTAKHSSFSESCVPISVSELPPENPITPPAENTTPQDTTNTQNTIINTQIPQNASQKSTLTQTGTQTKTNSPSSQQTSEKTQIQLSSSSQSGTIFLGSKTQSVAEISYSKDEFVRIYMALGFAAFCMILIILLALKKL